jgi:hypothetical protein
VILGQAIHDIDERMRHLPRGSSEFAALAIQIEELMRSMFDSSPPDHRVESNS